MRMADRAGIEVPLHGLLYGKNDALTYFILHFDRTGHKGKLHVEDFAQIGGRIRETKYRASMEQVAGLIDTYCTFPVVEKVKLFQRTLFCFLTGNEGMHLKNFSILRNKDVISLSPAYDLLNTTIVLPHPEEELALSLNGGKNKIKRHDLVEYFGRERLGLSKIVIDKILLEFSQARKDWEALPAISFLSSAMQEKYYRVLADRFARIF